ncbi:uncharacterized protein [Arachis hypogaea]|uniref:uncharacterized protein n=1 Tax=Arachis hypogaea TaxID=3818 RepID=UPI003B22828F
MDQQGNWDKYLPLIEFAYNNSYQQSIGMAPYETLYGRKCQSPLCWYDKEEGRILGPDLVQETTERIKHIREKIQTAQSRQKSYADIRRRPLEFNEGPFQILKRVGPVAYQVALHPYLSNLHDDFHVSQLKEYNPDESHVLQPETVQLRADLTYQTLQVRTVERSDKQLRGKTVSLVKVAWGQTGTEEYTWELEDKMRKDYPFLFSVAVGAAGKRHIPAMKIMIFDAYLMCI